METVYHGITGHEGIHTKYIEIVCSALKEVCQYVHVGSPAHNIAKEALEKIEK